MTSNFLVLPYARHHPVEQNFREYSERINSWLLYKTLDRFSLTLALVVCLGYEDFRFFCARHSTCALQWRTLAGHSFQWLSSHSGVLGNAVVDTSPAADDDAEPSTCIDGFHVAFHNTILYSASQFT